MRFLRTTAILILVGLPSGCALETASPRRPAHGRDATLIDQPPAGCTADGATAAGHDAADSCDE